MLVQRGIPQPEVERCNVRARASAARHAHACTHTNVDLYPNRQAHPTACTQHIYMHSTTHALISQPPRPPRPPALRRAQLSPCPPGCFGVLLTMFMFLFACAMLVHCPQCAFGPEGDRGGAAGCKEKGWGVDTSWGRIRKGYYRAESAMILLCRWRECLRPVSSQPPYHGDLGKLCVAVFDIRQRYSCNELSDLPERFSRIADSCWARV
jgi:hypothetical protein